MLGLADKSLFRREPTPADVEAAQYEIEQHEAAISSLQVRIFSLLSKVQALRREQKEHQDQINTYKGVTTLARRIPGELLSKIFEHCVEDGWYRAPPVVSQVCSAWRAAARAPRVWSHIYVNCNAPNFVGRTQFWLSMVAEAPLHITFAASLSGADSQDVANVAKLLLSRSMHWSTLALDPMPPRDMHTIFHLCASKHFKHLRYISINTEVGTIENTSVPEGDVFNLGDVFREDSAPSLNTIKYSCNVILSIPMFPSHLRSLVLEIREGPEWRPLIAQEFVTLLSNLGQLQSLTISTPPSSEHHFIASPDSPNLISLPNLSTLTLNGLDGVNGLLGFFDVPSLRSLHLRSSEDRLNAADSIDTSFLTLLANCSPPLETLELHDVDLRPETFAMCFMQLNELHELRLHDSHIDDETLNLLRGPRGLCPCLTRLDLRWCQNFQGDTLVKLVRNRNIVDDAGIRPRTAQENISGLSVAADPINEVTVINCSLVKEQDVLSLARMSVCRVIMRENDDYCRSRGCCMNAKYTQRLRFRHTANLSQDEYARIKLIM